MRVISLSGTWRILSVSTSKLWLTLPKAFLRSNNVITQPRCLIRALFIIRVRVSVLNVHLYVTVISCKCVESIMYKWCKFLWEYWLQSYRSKVFRFMRVVFFCALVFLVTSERHIFGKLFSFHTSCIIFTRCDCNIGLYLNGIILMASFGHGEADDFIFMIILIFFAYDGVCKLKFLVGLFSFFIHDGRIKVLWRFFSDCISLKYCLQSVSLKVCLIFSLCGSNTF